MRVKRQSRQIWASLVSRGKGNLCDPVRIILQGIMKMWGPMLVLAIGGFSILATYAPHWHCALCRNHGA